MCYDARDGQTRRDKGTCQTWGTFLIVNGTDHLQGNNHEILWAVCGRDYANLLGIGLMKCDEVSW
jgi:hypothetical protein